MSEHPAVAFLAAALARAEETAQAATAGPWHANTYDPGWDVCDFEASIGTQSSRDGWPDAATDVVGHGYEGGGVCGLPDAVHIAAFSPDVTLRLVAGARDILDEHYNTNDGDCAVCVVGQWGYPTHGGCSPAPWPCRTVLLLAQAWDWEDLASR